LAERVFLDASVLIAAAGSSTGGSSAAIHLISAQGGYALCASPTVLREVAVNVAVKLKPEATPRLAELLRVVARVPDASYLPAGVPALPDSYPREDHHVATAALAAGATACLTLDKGLLTDEVRRWGVLHGLRFMTPGEFLEWHRLLEAGDG
jgi:predicted nucleic acid-binding protein